MGLESWWKVSALLGLREEIQSLVFTLLEHSRSSCEPLGESSSMNVSPCKSGEGFCLFGHWDCVGSDLGEVVTGGHPCAWMPWQMEWIEVVMMSSIIRYYRRNVDLL